MQPANEAGDNEAGTAEQAPAVEQSAVASEYAEMEVQQDSGQEGNVDIDAIALDILKGTYGNDPNRRGAVAAKFGEDAAAKAQARVNELVQQHGSVEAARQALEAAASQPVATEGQPQGEQAQEEQAQQQQKPQQPRGGWVKINGKDVYLEGRAYESWMRKQEAEKPSWQKSLGDAFGAYFANYMGGGMDPSGVSASNRRQAEISERMAADRQKAAQRNMQIANRNPVDEANKLAASQAAQENAQKVNNLGNASAGAAALARGTAKADYQSQIARSDEQATQGTENQALAGELRGTAEQARAEAKQRDYVARDTARDNLARARISLAGRNESTGEEEEEDETKPVEEEKKEEEPVVREEKKEEEPVVKEEKKEEEPVVKEEPVKREDETKPVEEEKKEEEPVVEEEPVKEEEPVVEESSAGGGGRKPTEDYGTRDQLMAKHGRDGEFVDNLSALKYNDIGGGLYEKDGRKYMRSEVIGPYGNERGMGHQMWYYWPVGAGGVPKSAEQEETDRITQTAVKALSKDPTSENWEQNGGEESKKSRAGKQETLPRSVMAGKYDINGTAYYCLQSDLDKGVPPSERTWYVVITPNLANKKSRYEIVDLEDDVLKQIEAIDAGNKERR